MGLDDAGLFSLFFTHLSVHGSDHLFIGRFHASGAEGRNVSKFLSWIFQNPSNDCGGSLADHIRAHIVQFEVGDGQAVLCPVFLTSYKVGEFPVVMQQIPQLANICRRDKATSDEIVLEDVGDLLGVPLVRFLSPYGFHIFGVSKDNIAGLFQNVVNGNPIFSGGFHAHILAVVFGQPGCIPS